MYPSHDFPISNEAATTALGVAAFLLASFIGWYVYVVNKNK